MLDAAPTPTASSSPSPSSREDDTKVTVDPLAINGLGRKLRQAAAPTAPALALSEKGQCYSTKHALAPDEAICGLWCEAQLAAGTVDAAEYGTRFYENKGEICGCGKQWRRAPVLAVVRVWCCARPREGEQSPTAHVAYAEFCHIPNFTTLPPTNRCQVLRLQCK
jgi:hypothetical protein